jgi:hypothetical protein
MEETYTSINICISSNINYIENTYNVIIPSLLNSSTPAENIYIFVSGCSKEKNYINKDKITVYETKYSSFEFTPLIKIIEEQIYSKYWFLIHDTCEIQNPNFFKTISNFPYNDSPSVALFNNSWSCNMGAYEWKYLNDSSDKINQFKNLDTSPEKLKEIKNKIISHEDFLLDKKYFFTQDLKSEFITTEDGNTKVIDYFNGIGIKKTKTTWGWANINIQYVK